MTRLKIALGIGVATFALLCALAYRLYTETAGPRDMGRRARKLNAIIRDCAEDADIFN